LAPRTRWSFGRPFYTLGTNVMITKYYYRKHWRKQASYNRCTAISWQKLVIKLFFK
jgi:hypothetical protein